MYSTEPIEIWALFIKTQIIEKKMSVLTDKSSMEEAVDHMFMFIKKSAEHHGQFGLNRQVIRDSVIDGGKKMIGFARAYNIDISHRDMIKVYAFSVPYIMKWLGEGENYRTRISPSMIYYACILWMSVSYRGSIDLSNLPDIKNTCNIMEKLCRDGNYVASYTYLKGVQEACSASL